MSAATKATPEITRAAERYLEQYGDPLVMNTYLKVTILVLAVVSLTLAALVFRSQKALTDIGLAISVAPLTTAVMESVPSSEAGVASGVNNAVSRIAGLLAVAVFGLVLSAGFNRALDRSLSRMQLSPTVRQRVEMQRSKLAGAQIGEPLVMHAFEEAFVSGYRDVIWISVGLALLSALSAQVIGPKKRNVQVRS